MQDEELDQLLDTEEAVRQNLENIDNDIFEIEEIRLCNWTKKITDEVTGAKRELLYSREIPTKSMEI